MVNKEVIDKTVAQLDRRINDERNAIDQLKDDFAYSSANSTSNQLGYELEGFLDEYTEHYDTINSSGS